MPLLIPPPNGITVRMYRQGHGDCFLLAFPREGGGNPVYILIDCGYKPGSQGFLGHGKEIGDVVEHLLESTGGRLDLAVITHEHQDHVNGIWKKNDPYFEPFQIEEAWFAWTESPVDSLAKTLRKRHNDQLLGLINARHQLALAVGSDDAAVKRLDSLLSLELGEETDGLDRIAMSLAATDPASSVNKQGMKLVKDKASQRRGVHYWEPGKEAIDLPGTIGAKAYVIGPPKNESLLTDEDPVGDEGFDQNGGGGHGLSFTASAVKTANGEARTSPFGQEFHVAPKLALGPDGGFFLSHYGPSHEGVDDFDKKESPGNAAWRRIDEEWLYAAESLALKLNKGINNTSLVLAFELPKSKKVLLFAADAQRGNWISWNDCEWDDGDEGRVRDLLSRTILYKVGHHGSHNATLDGQADSGYANLSWMGQRFGGEFTVMITAVNKWAMEKNTPPCRHPLPSIRKALDEKARGRVFQTDQDDIKQPDSVSDAEWARFTSRVVISDLYFDYQVIDEP